jgi:hypothetical protein
MSESDTESGPPPFSQTLADAYIGKYILIGITRLSHAGEILGREQLHGIIAIAAPDGIVIELKGVNEGKNWRMPPSLETISHAKPGQYSLKSTGETVTDPDLLASWEIREPQKH